jgi:drug/metabolite transporter (DMT)-like permease
VSNRRAWIAAAVSIVLWAAAFPAIRIAVGGYQPAELTALRLLIASIALAVASPTLRLDRPRWADLPLILFSGLLGMAGYQLLLNWGEQTVPAPTASLLVAISPAYSVLLATAVLKERLTTRRLAGVCIAFAGAALIALSRGGGSLRLDLGTGLVLGAALAYGTYHVAHRPLLTRYSGAAVACYATWSATVLMAPFLFRVPSAMASASPEATAAAVFLGIGPSAIAFATWAYAVHRLGVSAAATSLYAAPAVALPISAVWLGELPLPVELAGGAIALAGVATANRTRAVGGRSRERLPTQDTGRGSASDSDEARRHGGHIA